MRNTTFSISQRNLKLQNPESFLNFLNMVYVKCKLNFEALKNAAKDIQGMVIGKGKKKFCIISKVH